METNYNGHSTKSGIYQIRNLNNGKVYVGSAKRFKSRYAHHLASLRKGTHHNKHLQGAFNLEGTDSFIFEVLEVVESEEQSDRLLVEQRHLDAYQENWELCYNFKKQTEAESRSCWTKNNPDERRAKASESMKARWQDEEYCKDQIERGKLTTTEMWKSEEHRAKVAESMKEYWSSEQSLEVRKKASKRMTEREISKDTRDKISKSVTEANKILWQDPEYRSKVAEGRKRSWANDQDRKERARKRFQETSLREYDLSSPTGEHVHIVNMQEFCKAFVGDHLLPCQMSKVARGMKPIYKGWTYYTMKEQT